MTQDYHDFLRKQAHISHERVADSLARALKQADYFDSVKNVFKDKFPDKVFCEFIPPTMPKMVFVGLENSEWLFIRNFKSNNFNCVQSGDDYFFLENVSVGSERPAIRIDIRLA